MRTVLLFSAFLWSGLAMAADFEAANRFLRDGAIQYGNTNFDPATNLVYRDDSHYKGRLDICQHSLEYAAALLSAGQQADRANAIISAVLDHQDLGEGSKTFGNFLWWHGETQVRDHNAVCFMTPWLSHILLEHGGSLSAANGKRLREALRHCIKGLRAHGSGPDYTNIWLLKAASMVMLSRALGDASLEADGARRIDQWIALTARDGLSEYNSPCYNAVDVYALEWIYHYAADEALRRKVAQCLDYLYADVFQQWHWEAGIGAGTHSRAYDRDRDTGRSLVSCLVFKQCGQPLREFRRSFIYVFAVNDYPVPARIRAVARKEGMYPFRLRYRILRGERAVDCALYMTPQFSLGTQTGRRPSHQDLPLKITYAGTKCERRSSYITPVPTSGHAKIASLQQGPLAIVLYEVDLKDSGLDRGYLRLNIEPHDGGMCDEVIVAGRPYDRSKLALEAGSVIGWRVNETLVALRLLEARGIGRDRPDERAPCSYHLGPVRDAGLCLDCLLAYKPPKPVAVNNLSCGFAVACATTREHKSLADFLRAFADWAVTEKVDGPRREIDWRAGSTRLELAWDGASNRIVSQKVDGRPLASQLRYDSPLIRLADGDPPSVVPPAR